MLAASKCRLCAREKNKTPYLIKSNCRGRRPFAENHQSSTERKITVKSPLSVFWSRAVMSDEKQISGEVCCVDSEGKISWVLSRVSCSCSGE